jgi:hypothetical protein
MGSTLLHAQSFTLSGTVEKRAQALVLVKAK